MVFDFDYQFKEVCGNNMGLIDRNRNWMQQLPVLMQNRQCFVTVGLLHLYGKCGLITQLRELGYSVGAVKDLDRID